MNRWGAILCAFGFALLPVYSFAQLPISNDDIAASEHSCRRLQMVLAARDRNRTGEDAPAPDDDYALAGKACDRLQVAVESSNQQQIQSAAASLRPMFARLGMDPATPQEQLAALEKKDANVTGEDLFDDLPELAKRAFDAGEVDSAELYAQRLLKMAPSYPQSWNYGNAIFHGNAILGRVALRHGDIKQAKAYLLSAGQTPGSAQLDTFGPNMSLARELLEKNQSDVVLRFFELCRRFWDLNRGKLDQWSAEVKQGKIPDFGANLAY